MNEATSPQAIIVMGVCGTGKSTIGRALAAALECPYADADDFHPAENVAKMRSGIALDDRAREPWLDSLRAMMESHLQAGRSIVLACSALRETYRERLQPAGGNLRIIFLQGDRPLLAERMQARTDHYMPPELLDSQLATLEVPAPADALWCNVASTIDEILGQALAYVQDS
jgi:gluconokinase